MGVPTGEGSLTVGGVDQAMQACWAKLGQVRRPRGGRCGGEGTQVTVECGPGVWGSGGGMVGQGGVDGGARESDLEQVDRGRHPLGDDQHGVSGRHYESLELMGDSGGQRNEIERAGEKERKEKKKGKKEKEGNEVKGKERKRERRGQREEEKDGEPKGNGVMETREGNEIKKSFTGKTQDKKKKKKESAAMGIEGKESNKTRPRLLLLRCTPHKSFLTACCSTKITNSDGS